MRGFRVAVGATPTKLLDPDESLSAIFALPQSATGPVDLGGPTVASGSGFSLEPGAAVQVAAMAPGDALYAITPSGSQTVHVLVGDEETPQS